MTRNDLIYQIQSLFGVYPALYYPLFARKYPFNQMAVGKTTQVCIEGFPRSANSYAVVAFRLANPDVNIAHHLHVPAQLIRAQKKGIPSVLLIREPAEAVASFLVFQHSSTADLYLKAYIRFYHTLRSIRSHLVIADFETVIKNMNAVIQALNEKFRRNFQLLRDQAEQENEIFTKLKEVNDRFFAGQKNKSMYPDESRQKAKAKAKDLVLNNSRFSTAQELYLEFLENALKEA